MTVVVWVADDTWQDCVDAARGFGGEEFLLLHVSDHDVPGAAHGAFAGLRICFRATSMPQANVTGELSCSSYSTAASRRFRAR